MENMKVGQMAALASLPFSHEQCRRTGLRRCLCWALQILAALFLPLGLALADSGYMEDPIWAPRVVELELLGEAKAPSGQRFLVGGSNATARVRLDKYSGDWKEYGDPSGVMSGGFRHSMTAIILYGYAAAELNDKPIPNINKMSYEEYVAAYDGCKAVKLFKSGASMLDLTHVSESEKRIFTTAARNDIKVTLTVEKKGESGDIYRVVDIKGPVPIPRNLWPQEIDMSGTFEFPFVLPTGLGSHGQYFWTVFTNYKNESYVNTILGRTDLPTVEGATFPRMEDIITLGMEAQLLITNELGMVFFDKYGQDDAGTPNWFKYWKEDGACPSLKRHQNMIVLDKNDKLAPEGYGCWSDNTEFFKNYIARPFNIENVLAPPDGKVHFSYKWSFSEGYYFDHNRQKWIWIQSPAGSHYPDIVRVSHPKNYEFSGPHIYGIHTVEEVLAHEIQHCYTHNVYSALHGVQADSDLHIQEFNIVDWALNNGRNWYCDFLTDAVEGMQYVEYLFDTGKTDTYNLGQIKNVQYKRYGDDEFLAMMAANKATKEGRAIATNDWAFPGEQSYLPVGVRNGWSHPAAAGMVGMLAKSNRAVVNNVMPGEDSSCSVSVGSVNVALERDSSTSRISWVRCSFPLSTVGVNELRVIGILTDGDGNVAASAFASAGNGDSSVELVFSGKDIYESGLVGPFHIASLKFSDFSKYDSVDVGVIREIEGGILNVARQDFLRGEGYLLDVANETVTTNGIEVSVNVEVNAAGKYDIVATIVNTNGIPVASGNAVANCAHGTNSLTVVFAASEILESGVDGPYVIDNIAVYKDGVRIDSRLDFCALRKMYKADAFWFDDEYGESDFDPEEFMAQFEEYTPPVEPTPPESFWVFFNPNGGTVVETMRDVIEGEKVGTLPIPTLENDEFLGWYTELDGGTKITDSTIVMADMMCHAHWKNGGGSGTGDGVDDGGSGDGDSPTPTPTTDPTPAPDPTPDPDPTPTSNAHLLYKAVDGAVPAVASEYNGYLYDAKSGAVKGTIQVKVGKAKLDKKTNKLLAAIKANVVLGGKKVALKASEKGKAELLADGPTNVELAGGETCTVTLGEEGVSGTYGACIIDGARNFFTSKDKAEQAAANAVLGKWLGSVNVVWDGGSVNVSIAKKGKAKVKGTLADGKTKVSAKSVFLVGEEWCAVPVAAPKANLTFTLWLSRDGRTAVAEGLGSDAIAGKPGALAANAAFHVSKDAALWTSISGTVLKDYIPDGFKVASNGGKWVLPKAGKVVYKDGMVDGSKLGVNPSGLKLTYKAKNGSFKGSFKVYAVNGGKAKATAVNITGVMAKGVGYGTATIKGKGSVSVTVK